MGEPVIPSTPDIPVADYHDQARETAQGYLDSGMLWKFLAGLVTTPGPSLTALLSFAISNLDTVLGLFTDLMTKFQGQGNPQFFQFVASMLSDLLGVNVNEEAILNSWALHGDVSALTAVGGALYDTLTKEFGTGSAITPQSGYNAARAFLGYMIAFSVREANVETIISILPESLRIFDGLRHYGSNMARNLGLGRLARRALQPLIQVLVSDPLTWYLNEAYRPKLLQENLAVRALLRGNITQDKFNQILSWQGYGDDSIQATLDDTYTRPPIPDYYLLSKYTGMDANTLLTLASQTGTSLALASQFLAVESYREADTEVAAFLTELRTQRVAGYIDAPTFQAALDGLPISDAHKQWFQNVVGQQIEWPRVHITAAQAESAYVAGVIDLSDYQQYLTKLGYSDTDQDVMFNLTGLKLEKATYEAAKAEWVYLKAVAAAKKAGLPPPPQPPGIT